MDLFTASLYADAPQSIGAAVYAAVRSLGVFDGKTVQRSELLDVAQRFHRAANDGKTNPQHEALGRELRGRDGGTRQQVYDRLLDVGWRIVCEDGRVWAEKCKPMAGVTPPPAGAVANPGHPCAETKEE